MELKKRLKELLKRKKMTAKELSSKMGISESALSLSISGNPTLDRLNEIAAALNVDVQELFAAPADGVITCPHCGNTIDLHPTPKL